MELVATPKNDLFQPFVVKRHETRHELWSNTKVRPIYLPQVQSSL
jgi:hypothetical protein